LFFESQDVALSLSLSEKYPESKYVTLLLLRQKCTILNFSAVSLRTNTAIKQNNNKPHNAINAAGV